MAAMVLCASAQNDVTEFLGIPVDGAKATMIQKLKAKGFRINPYKKDVLTGRFNGRDVNIWVVTNGDKVCRIMVCDIDAQDETSIRVRFNNLCRQFEQNPRYISIGNQLIPDDENISFGMTIKKKQYQAIFLQAPKEWRDSTLLREKIKERVLPIFEKKYTAEELAKPTEAMEKEYMQMVSEYLIELCSKKQVWFMITERFGEYDITMYYDNKYNQANGEDL